MAIADYFQRSVNAASQVLKDFDYDGFVKLLDRHRIGLVIDAAAAKSPEGRATADLTVRLLARFYPKIAIVAADAPAKAKVAALRALALAINPKISITDNAAGVTHCLVVGKTQQTLKGKNAHVIYIGSSNWTVRLSKKKPTGSGASKNPFAAGVAACLGVANVFRAVFAKQLPNSELDGEVTFSLLTLAKGTGGSAYRTTDIGRAFLVGAGAIGNGALWALVRSGVTGELGIVEPQQLDLGNMQRYVMPVMDDVERSKTTLAEKWFAGAKGLKVVPHKQTWDEFVHSLQEEDWRFDRVLAALDSAEARIGVQASLPKWIANAYTLGSCIGVSRHHFLSDSACLACVYIPREKSTSEDVLVASALGFQSEPANNTNLELMEIRRRLDRNEPCDRAFLDAIAVRKNISLDRLLPFENRPLRDLYHQGVCGGQIIGINVDGKELRAEVPMAFQSAMAGILLAAELVLDASGARDPAFPTVTRFDLHQAMPEVSTSVRRSKDANGRCLCQDEDYQKVYVEKYGVALPRAQAQEPAASS